MMSKKKEKYFEPNAAPKEVLNKKSKRKLLIRFENEDDVKEFQNRTGIRLIRNKHNLVSYPVNSLLDV